MTRRILIADPDKHVCRMISNALEAQSDVEVITAESSLDFLAELISRSYDMVILEVGLLCNDRASVLRWLRGTPYDLLPPVVFVIGEEPPGTLALLSGLPVEYCLRKPFPVNQLLVQLHQDFDEACLVGTLAASPSKEQA